MCKIIKYAGIITFLWLLLATIRISGQLYDKYIGCFVDNINDRQLESVLKDQDNLTIEICIQKCYSETNETQQEMTFAALKNGRNCLCRNNSGQQLSDRNCNVKCSGNDQQMCGGNAASEFYSLYSVCGAGYFGPNCDRLCHCKKQLPCDRKTGICSDGCEEHWNGTNCNIGYVQQQYIGCYGDRWQSPAMDVKNPGEKTGANMGHNNSNDFCIEICSNNNYTYAGMQYGFDCNCGEVYNRYGDRNHRETRVNCNMRCSGIGKESQTCGGEFANSVYFVCPVGFYGRDCINQCHCSDGGPCRFNGSCLTSPLSACKPGWKGSACNVRDCEVNNGDCETDETCETVDLHVGYANLSICRCKDGSYRDYSRCKPVHLYYVGCYKGNTMQYASVELQTNDTLTVEFCILKCRQLNKKYSIIQGGTTCLCGDDYGQISPDDECQVPCVGSNLQYCGGKNTVDGTPIYVVYTAKSLLREYIGCYKDEMDPAMKLRFFGGREENTTIDSCIRQCAAHNFTYAGLQYSYVCFCGDSYDKYGPLPESNCNMNCTGNRNQICGGTRANSIYAVNDILLCSTDRDCKRNEACDAIDLKYTNVSRCRCKPGFHRMSTWDLCTDVDECQSDVSPCNSTSGNCFNTIGSYLCECKVGFAHISGQCEDIDECNNDLLVCNNERELCKNTIGSYQCRCEPGYEYSTFGNCTDVDECQLDGSSSPCNTISEYCNNSIGSYTCACKEGYAKISGNCEEFNNNPTTAIILGSLLAISLLINVLFVIFRIKSANSNLEPCKVKVKSDIETRCGKLSDQQEMTYDEIPNPVGQDSVYEQIILEKRQIVQNPTSEYAALKHDDHLYVETTA